MNKKLSRISVAAVAAVLCVSNVALNISGLTASAVDRGLSISNYQSGHQYDVYKVASMNLLGTDSNNQNQYGYTIAGDFAGFFGEGSDYSANSTGIYYRGTLVSTDSSQATPLTNALYAYASTVALTPFATIGSSDGLSLQTGYYLVMETDESVRSNGGITTTRPMLIQVTDNDVAIYLKDVGGDPDFEKVIIQDDGTSTQVNQANIGDSISYQINSAIPHYGSDVSEDNIVYTISDTFSAGLTFNHDTRITACGEILTDGYGYSESSNSFLISLQASFLINTNCDSLTVDYSATLNDSARVDSVDGNPNTAILSYSNNPYLNNETASVSSNTKTYTYGFRIKKVDLDDESIELADAVFELYDWDHNQVYGSDGEPITVTTGDNGEVTISGITEGEYYLRETRSPNGYALPSDYIPVVLRANTKDGELLGTSTIETDSTIARITTANNAGDQNLAATITIRNKHGVSLPETGAITSLICVIAGLAVTLVGGGYFIRSSRKANK